MEQRERERKKERERGRGRAERAGGGLGGLGGGLGPAVPSSRGSSLFGHSTEESLALQAKIRRVMFDGSCLSVCLAGWLAVCLSAWKLRGR
eukprot:COSAG01_NODE_9143_length_2539_cov_1.945082_3_plen_91_part_00